MGKSQREASWYQKDQDTSYSTPQLQPQPQVLTLDITMVKCLSQPQANHWLSE